MKVTGIWHKKPSKNQEFRTKNLEKAWNLVFGKRWEPWNCFWIIEVICLLLWISGSLMTLILSVSASFKPLSIIEGINAMGFWIIEGINLKAF